MYQRNEATSVILPVHEGHFVLVLYYPIAGWLFQACIVFTRSRGVLPHRRVTSPSQYCITRSRGATSCQYCISRAPGGYSKPVFYCPFAGRLFTSQYCILHRQVAITSQYCILHRQVAIPSQYYILHRQVAIYV